MLRRPVSWRQWALRYAPGLALVALGHFLSSEPVPGAVPVVPDGWLEDIAVDRSGGLFVAGDGGRIWRVSLHGRVTCVAGCGREGFGGDGGPATRALLGSQGFLAVDHDGSLFVADQANYRVRRVDPAGTITTVAGSGASGSAGDGGPAVAAKMSPLAVAVGPDGTLFICEDDRVRRVDRGGVITTAATGVVAPIGAVVDRKGDLYVASQGPEGVCRLEAGRLVPVKGTTGRHLWDTAVDSRGNVYFVAFREDRVFRADRAGRVSAVAGGGAGGDGGPAVNADIGQPRGIAVDPHDNLLIIDGWYNVRKVDQAGVSTTALLAGCHGRW